jgi:hypothetical protein
MSESEEIKLEYEITQLQKHPERILIISKRPQYNPSTCEFHIEITFPETNYIFILQISLTNHYIHLYSKNFHPLNDGRDLIRLAYPNLPLNNSYSPDKINLKTIIEMLTILTQSSQIKQNKLFNSIGNFYIGNEYDVNIIKSIDHLFKHNIIIIENVNGVVSTETISLCTISNDYFCLYDYDNSHVHKFTLSFYSSLTALSSFKMSSDSSVLTLMWKQKGSSIPYEMQLTASLLYEDDVNVIEHIVALLINLFKERGVKIGADVPYCLMRGTALSEGIGEKLTPLNRITGDYVVIAKPKIGVSTKYVYENLDLSDNAKHHNINRMIGYIEEMDKENLFNCIGNILETVTEKKYNVISEIKEFLKDKGAVNSLMSGSGPTVFAIFNSKKTAQLACDAIQKEYDLDIAKVVTLI